MYCSNGEDFSYVVYASACQYSKQFLRAYSFLLISLNNTLGSFISHCLQYPSNDLVYVRTNCTHSLHVCVCVYNCVCVYLSVCVYT